MPVSSSNRTQHIEILQGVRKLPPSLGTTLMLVANTRRLRKDFVVKNGVGANMHGLLSGLGFVKLHLKLEWPGGPNDLDLVLGLDQWKLIFETQIHVIHIGLYQSSNLLCSISKFALIRKVRGVSFPQRTKLWLPHLPGQGGVMSFYILRNIF